MVAFYNRIPVGHIEAGLRTGNKWQPFPEEINRRLVGGLADLHFAPTSRARENLLGEGIPDSAVYVTGNPVIDALKIMNKRLEITTKEPLLWLNSDRRLVLVTSHRRENWGKPIEAICQALLQLADRIPDIDVLYPVHPNPEVREPVQQMLCGRERIHVTDHLTYPLMVLALQCCHLVLTDSGGIQEEAPSLGKPVLVMRDVTERPEAVEAGTVKLVGTDTDRIVREATILLSDSAAYEAMAARVNPYGDGYAAQRIMQAILCFLGLSTERPQAFVAEEK
jgi:UDP-N-acetylglucosamine 2-epimerase (non-hydrolysing)